MTTPPRWPAAIPRSTWLLLAIGIASMWCIGILVRNYWTPDEPREAALALSMRSTFHALPWFAGEPFAEKPPLGYWLSASASRVLGEAAAALRAPQLLYALLALAAVIGLGRRAGGALAGWISGALFATSQLVYQVQVWLASDALLLCGVCVALYGAYAALESDTTSRRLANYLVMFAGCTLAFYAKNLAGLLVPVTTLVCFLTWERRWRELRRWELWVGVALPLACIVPWVLELASATDGAQQLRLLFWNNLVGRAVTVQSDALHAYASEHRNWFGKYWLELLLYALPWTPIVVGALWHAARHLFARRRVRGEDSLSKGMRFAFCAAVPGLVVLSLAATARNIYAAPSMVGIALLGALWCVNADGSSPAALRRAVSLSSLLVTAMATLIFALTLLVQRSAVAGATSALGAASLAASAAIAVWAARRAFRRDSGSPARWLLELSAAYSILMSLGILALVMSFNRWQDLETLSNQLKPDLAGRPVVLWHPDETTEAWVEMYLPGAPALSILGTEANGPDTLRGFLDQHPDARILALEHGPAWGWRTWQRYLSGAGMLPAESDPKLPLSDLGLKQWTRVERPGGRAYRVLGRAPA